MDSELRFFYTGSVNLPLVHSNEQHSRFSCCSKALEHIPHIRGVAVVGLTQILIIIITKFYREHLVQS